MKASKFGGFFFAMNYLCTKVFHEEIFSTFRKDLRDFSICYHTGWLDSQNDG